MLNEKFWEFLLHLTAFTIVTSGSWFGSNCVIWSKTSLWICGFCWIWHVWILSWEMKKFTLMHYVSFFKLEFRGAEKKKSIAPVLAYDAPELWVTVSAKFQQEQFPSVCSIRTYHDLKNLLRIPFQYPLFQEAQHKRPLFIHTTKVPSPLNHFFCMHLFCIFFNILNPF